MAFVTAAAVGSRELSGVSVCASSRTRSQSALSMNYGDYSYLTDSTKGHVGQYYVDKFRRVSDFARGVPASDADAKLGRDAKGRVLVPKEGIPQQLEAPLTVDPTAPPDPRIAEAEGSVYRWDANYQDPKFAPETYADLDDETVIDDSFQKFRALSSSERGASLTGFDLAANLKREMLKKGLSESYLLTLEGQLDREFARMQEIAEIPFLNPTGKPQTQIPGTPYVGSIGALDFQKKEEDSLDFWSADTPQIPYKRPKGSNAPELPYNTSPSVESLQAAQEAAGIIPASK